MTCRPPPANFQRKFALPSPVKRWGIPNAIVLNDYWYSGSAHENGRDGRLFDQPPDAHRPTGRRWAALLRPNHKIA
jgi:hypothetical protein